MVHKLDNRITWDAILKILIAPNPRYCRLAETQTSTNPIVAVNSSLFDNIKKLFRSCQLDKMETEEQKNRLKYICSERRSLIRQRNKEVSKQLRNEERRKMLLNDIERHVSLEVLEKRPGELSEYWKMKARAISELTESIKTSNLTIRRLNDSIINLSEQLTIIQNS